MPRRGVPAARRFAGARAQRQPTNWGRIVATTAVTIPVSSKVELFTVTLSNSGISETVRRTRGRFMIDMPVSGEFLGALGFIVVNDLAVAAGVASIPGPVTEASDDGWFVWVPVVGRQVANSTQASDFEFDSKGMRRIEDGFTVSVVCENASSTVAFEIGLAFSILTSLS